MVDKLRLEVLLSAVDKVTGPLKNIATGSKATAKAIAETDAALKKLERQQRTLAQLGKEQERLADTRGALQTAHADNASGKAIAKLTKEYERQQAVVERLQATVREKGWSTAAADQRKLADSISAANAQLDAQKRKMEQQAQVENRLHALREKHSSDMARLGMRGAMAGGAMLAGQRMGGMLMQPVQAFSDAESATSQLRAAMMRADGAVPPEFAKVNELAERLGDKLPGTTADFINMMTMLQRQGMSTQTILGGMGEAAAYLGVQLKMPVTAAAEFAAKMQDATQTAEGDLMGLMDTIQRAFYLGVDPTNMLQGFTKVGAVMPYLGKKGLEASNMLAPMLVMMDQAGMKGEASGNAIRKIVQMSMNAEKLGKANKMLAGTGVQLDFYDKKGKFAGFDNLFAQLQKLKTIESDVQRTAVMHKLFGDDAETYQVLNTLMEKGKAGYDETVGKLQAQADLRMRVNEELKTLAAVTEAAQGSFTNLLKDLGATIAPELKALIGWLGEMAASAGAWARENPRVVKTLMLLAAGVAGLMVVAGGLGVALVGVLAPLAMARFLTGRFVLGLLAAKTGAAGAASGVGLLGRAAGWLTTAWAALRTIGVGGMFRAMGSAMASPAAWLGVLRGGAMGLWRLLTVFARANPIAALVLGLVGLFAGLYAHWDKIKEYFNAGEWWSMAKEIWAALEWGFNAATMGLYDLLKSIAVSALTGAWAGIKNFLGVGGGEEAPGASKARSVAAAAAVAAAVPLSAAADATRLDTYQPVLQPAAPVQLMPRADAAPAPRSTTNQITIHAAPGMDEKAVARAVTFEMDRRERAKNSRVASQLHDID
ncbi:phage tail tape measure protein [Acidovorax sp. GBBC 3334]|uniref:phage tail tape measure protein n=1 Tax=Acidovorax sp. GBBC 3334 TaxID=2940496 RepID=UPI0023024E5C|nr:phage tail tape measure protein [Acidovorax sp. GBBC 3334]MDA8455270.1 phage tail tape measure protein [Acidovorax sp. GBBC 3334]